jgi:5-methylcytosine-specific restriction protein B
MIPREIKAKHVRDAIDEIKQDGVPAHRKSKKYHLIYGGHRYPPKYVLSLAAKHATGRELASKAFNGGEEANRPLRNLGFTVI